MALNKNVVAGTAAAGITAGALAMNSAGVVTSLNHVAGVASGIAAGTKVAVGNILGAKGLAVVGTAAPFALPVVGGLAGYKMAEMMGIENKTIKAATSVSGAIGGAALLGTVGSPLLLAGGAGYGIYRLGKRIIKGK